AALVATGQVDAGSALNGLTQATTNTQLSLSAMPVFLESFVAHTTSANIGAACQGAMNLLGMGLPADNVMGLLIQFAGSANTSALTQIGEEFSYLVTSGRENLALIEIELGQSITAGSLTSGHAMTIYAGIAEGASMNGDATTATAALGQITALMQPPVNGSAQDAFTAFCSVAGSLAATQSSSLMQAVGAQMYALVAADPSALSGMGAAISGGTLTSAQAAGLLLGMLHNTDVVDQLVMPQSVPSAIVGEIDTLVSGNLMAPTDFLQALSNSVGTNAVTADAAVSILANCWPSAGASFANQIAGTLITMIQGGLSATQVLYDINGTINHPLTVDQAVGLMTALSSPNTQMGSTISAAVATDLINILSQGGAVMTIDQVISGIDHAVTNTTHPVDAGSAVALLAQLGNYAVQNPTAYISFDMGRLVVQEIVSLIASNPAGAALLYTVAPALANTPDHGVGFMMDIAAHSTQACQIAFGSIVANLVGNQTMTAADIVAEIRTAYATGLTQGTFTPFALGVVTASQELGLLAGVLAGVASPGHLDASTLNTAVHAELLAAIQTPPLRATDVQVAAALEAVGVNSGQILAAVNTEIAKLEDDVGPKMLIDVAATTHADMGAVGTQLTQLIQNGKITVGEAMNDIVAANANGYLTGSQALAMVTSALASTTSVGIYLSPTATGNNNWFVSTAGAFEALVQRAANNISAESIGAAIESMSGIGPTLLYPSSAVSMLASIAAYPDLQATAATHIGNLIAGNTGPNADSNLAPNNVAMSVAACVSSVAAPGHLTAAEAVQLLATVAAHGGAASTYGGIAQGLGDPSVVTVISPDIVATTIEGMLNSTPPTLTAQQALHFLAPYGAAGPEAVGHAIGDLITAGQVSMADFTALIYGGAQQTEQQIQSLRWGQAFGSGQIDFSDAVLVLTAMTSRTPAAVAELATIMSSDTDYVGTLVEQRLVNAGQHPTTSGPTPLEVVRALVTLMVDPRMTQVYGASTANHILDDMFSFVNISPSIPAPTLPTQYWLSSSDIL